MRHVLAGAAKLFRQLRGASPTPLVQKAVIHLGMPKAGSTSIQLALHGAQDSTLTRQGIWFTPPNSEFNDCIMYDMLVARDFGGLSRYAETKARAAASAGADIVIFSAERLFTLDDIKIRLAQLAKAMRPWSAEVSFCVVGRDIRGFLRSYITQMIYNADLTLEDHSLAEWVIDQIGLIAEGGYPVDFIGLEDQNVERNVAERLVSLTTGREVDIPLTRANVTPSRPLVYALTEGLVARMRAIETGGDINATELDGFRTAFATAYDNSVHTTSDPGEVYRVLQRLNQIVEDNIAEYIDRCFQECPAEKLAFYEELLASGMDRDRTVLRQPAPLGLGLIEAARGRDSKGHCPSEREGRNSNWVAISATS